MSIFCRLLRILGRLSKVCSPKVHLAFPHCARKVDVDWKPRPYLNVVSNSTLVKAYEENAGQLGVELETDENILRLVCCLVVITFQGFARVQ